MPHPTLMSAGDTGLLVIDVQEKLLPKILHAERLVRNIAFLIDGARLLEMPVQATEQYPRGLGPTVAELAGRLPDRPDKVKFSSCGVPAIADNFRRAARPKLVLTGIESHVCVLHTALDLLALDFRVYLPVDAVSAALYRGPRHGPAASGASGCDPHHHRGLPLRVARRLRPSALQGRQWTGAGTHETFVNHLV